jgi:hypothetical protein
MCVWADSSAAWLQLKFNLNLTVPYAFSPAAVLWSYVTGGLVSWSTLCDSLLCFVPPALRQQCGGGSNKRLLITFMGTIAANGHVDRVALWHHLQQVVSVPPHKTASGCVLLYSFRGATWLY